MPPSIVIIGGGFGGLAAAKELRGTPVDVTVIDRTNHHLFQPLLYQVAMAGLAPSDITVPIRWILRNERNANVILGEVMKIDPARREVTVDGLAAPLGYDALIVTAGSRHAYFGHDAWESNAPGLKLPLADALELRRRFLTAFERAEQETDADERQRLMTFVIVGGGPTGVELAGMMIEIVRKAMPRDFRNIDTRRTRVVLVEAGPRLLPAFPERSAARARRDLEHLGVEVRTSTTVTGIDSQAERASATSSSSPRAMCFGRRGIRPRTSARCSAVRSTGSAACWCARTSPFRAIRRFSSRVIWRWSTNPTVRSYPASRQRQRAGGADGGRERVKDVKTAETHAPISMLQ